MNYFTVFSVSVSVTEQPYIQYIENTHTYAHTDTECTWPDLFIGDDGSLLLSCSVIRNDHNMNAQQAKVESKDLHNLWWKEKYKLQLVKRNTDVLNKAQFRNVPSLFTALIKAMLTLWLSSSRSNNFNTCYWYVCVLLQINQGFVAYLQLKMQQTNNCTHINDCPELNILCMLTC